MWSLISDILRLNRKRITTAVGAKADANDFEGRFREVMADPSNRYIPRCPDAGTVRGGCVVMHNGLKVALDYYGAYSRIFSLNKGVHEPQEERLFMEVLRYMPPGATMIELGAYWAFYSMWFQQSVPEATNIMIEENHRNLQRGKRNFEMNGMRGHFVHGRVGKQNGVDLAALLDKFEIGYVDLLHMDIQGAEVEVLQECDSLFSKHRIGYVFVSTHSQDLHLKCLDILRNSGTIILASADFDNETYCYDGIIVARDSSIPGMPPMEIDVRTKMSVPSVTS